MERRSKIKKKNNLKRLCALKFANYSNHRLCWIDFRFAIQEMAFYRNEKASLIKPKLHLSPKLLIRMSCALFQQLATVKWHTAGYRIIFALCIFANLALIRFRYSWTRAWNFDCNQKRSGSQNLWRCKYLKIMCTSMLFGAMKSIILFIFIWNKKTHTHTKDRPPQIYGKYLCLREFHKWLSLFVS